MSKSDNIQWMTFHNPKKDWFPDNEATIYGENDIVTKEMPRLFYLHGMSFFVAYKTALEEGLVMIGYSEWNMDRKYKRQSVKEVSCKR